MENQSRANVPAILALVFGVVAMIGAWLPYVGWVAWLIGVAAIVLGAVGMKKANATNSGRGLAIAGLVIGIVGTALGLIGFMCVLCAIGILAAAGE